MWFSRARRLVVLLAALALPILLPAGAEAAVRTGVETAVVTSVPGAGDSAVSMTLSPRAVHDLRDGHNFLATHHGATKRSRGRHVVLSLPLRLTYPDHGRRTGTSRLDGVVSFTGAGPHVSWRELRVDRAAQRVTAVVRGERHAVLRVGRGAAVLRLTRAGAHSLDRAAAGAPFAPGQVFASHADGIG